MGAATPNVFLNDISLGAAISSFEYLSVGAATSFVRRFFCAPLVAVTSV